MLQWSSTLVNWINAAANTTDSRGVCTGIDPDPLDKQCCYRLNSP